MQAFSYLEIAYGHSVLYSQEQLVTEVVFQQQDALLAVNTNTLPPPPPRVTPCVTPPQHWTDDRTGHRTAGHGRIKNK